MIRLIPVLALLIGCSDQFENEVGGPKGSNSGGYDGPQHCWDLDYDGEADADEDTNGDGTVDVYDCRGEDGGGGSGSNGSDGQDCWDLDGDGIGDPEEDTNGDGVVDVYDCRDDGGDDTGGGGGDAWSAVQVEVHEGGGCAVLVNGTVQCWGSSADGSASFPEENVLRIAHSDIGHYRCAVLVDGSASCWPSSGLYQEVSFASNVSDIAIGREGLICALKTSGEVECVSGETLASEVRTRTYSQVQGSSSGICGLSSAGIVDCWDLTDGPELGEEDPPATVMNEVDVGRSHWACAITPSAEVTCWGRETTSTSVLKTPPSDLRCSQLGIGTHHGCCIDGSDTARCWGSNLDGQTSAPLGVRFASVHGGYRHSCGLTLDGRVACWGGDGSQSDVPDYLRAD